MTILGLFESFEMMNRSGQAQPWRSLTVYLSESIKGKNVKIYVKIFTQFSSLQFVPLKFGIDVFDSFDSWKLCTFQQRSNLGNSQKIFHYNFRVKCKFWIMIFLVQIYENLCKKFHVKYQFLREKLKNIGFFYAFF